MHLALEHERPQGPVHRRHRGHQLRLPRAGGRTRRRADRAQPGQHQRRARCPTEVAVAARRHPGPRVGPGRARRPRVRRRRRLASRSRPSTSGPTSTCSAGGPGSTSSSAPRRPTRRRPARLPVTESTPLRNPFWQYSRDKIACEDLLVARLPRRGLPGRRSCGPSHTYDQTLVPFDGGWTDVARMRAGKPVVVHGDGTSLWTLTHHVDFAPRLRAAARAPPDARRGVPHHLRRRAHLEPDRRMPRPRPPASSRELVHVAVRRDRRGRPGVGRRPARRQGALDGLRQHEAARCRARTTARPSRSSRAPARSSPGTTPTRRASRSTPGWTPSWTGSSRSIRCSDGRAGTIVVTSRGVQRG